MRWNGRSYRKGQTSGWMDDSFSNTQAWSDSPLPSNTRHASPTKVYGNDPRVITVSSPF